MASFSFVIKDELGIHARPAGLLVKEAGALASEITIEKNGKKGSAKKIFGVMGLGVKCGDEIIVTVEGDSEAADTEVMKAFFEKNL